jgi:hypothetical protein
VHGERFATFTAFLGRMGLDHAFAHAGAAEAFDRRIAAISFPGAVVGATPGRRSRDGSSTTARLRSRARRLAQRPGARRVRAGLRMLQR